MIELQIRSRSLLARESKYFAFSGSKSILKASIMAYTLTLTPKKVQEMCQPPSIYLLEVLMIAPFHRPGAVQIASYRCKTEITEDRYVYLHAKVRMLMAK